MVISDNKMVTRPYWSGLRIFVTNSHNTRALRKPEKQSREESLAEKVKRRVAGSILDGAITISNHIKVEFSCAYSCLLQLLREYIFHGIFTSEI